MMPDKSRRPEASDDHICPFLASWWDERSVCRYASGDNRCYAQGRRRKVWGLRIGEKKPYRYVSKHRQSDLCLTGHFRDCPLYQRRKDTEATSGSPKQK